MTRLGGYDKVHVSRDFAFDVHSHALGELSLIKIIYFLGIVQLIRIFALHFRNRIHEKRYFDVHFAFPMLLCTSCVLK